MENDILLDKLSKLPESLKQEVYDFVNFLITKCPAPDTENASPVFGSGKGMFIMKPDFDEPLEDFKDYM